MAARPQIGELLVRAKAVTPADLTEAVGLQADRGGRIGTNLLELGLVEEQVLAEMLGQQFGCDWTCGEIEISEWMVQAIPGVLARRCDVVPWQLDGKRLKVLCASPTDNLPLLDEMGFRLGKIVKPVVAPEFRIFQILRRYFDSPRQMRALDFGVHPKGKKQQAEEPKKEQQPVADLMDDSTFNEIYKEAATVAPVAVPVVAPIVVPVAPVVLPPAPPVPSGWGFVPPAPAPASSWASPPPAAWAPAPPPPAAWPPPPPPQPQPPAWTPLPPPVAARAPAAPVVARPAPQWQPVEEIATPTDWDTALLDLGFGMTRPAAAPAAGVTAQRAASIQDRALAHKDKAEEFANSGNLQEALEEIIRALDLNPADTDARKRSADLLASLGLKAQAIAEYEELADHFAANANLAHAIAIGKQILQLDPHHKRTQDMLARHYAAREPKSAAPVRAGRGVVVAKEMPHAPLFSRLEPELFRAMIDEAELHEIPAGKVILREGTVGRSMFILSVGTVKIVRDIGTPTERTVAEMAEGACFGEIGLLLDVPRLASVVAATDCLVLEISREKLAELQQDFAQLAPVLQQFYRERLLLNLLRSNPIFQHFDEPAMFALMNEFAVRKAQPGEVLIREDEPGSEMFVVLRGVCEAFHIDPAGGHHVYAMMGEGALFGEISLLRGCAASATVRSQGVSLLFALGREAFREHLLSHETVRAALVLQSDERLQRTIDLKAKIADQFAAWL